MLYGSPPKIGESIVLKDILRSLGYSSYVFQKKNGEEFWIAAITEAPLEKYQNLLKVSALLAVFVLFWMCFSMSKEKMAGFKLLVGGDAVGQIDQASYCSAWKQVKG